MRSLRVLVVDDDRDCANALGMLVRLWGHEVSSAYTADQALAAVASFTPDVALLDLSVPRTNGFKIGSMLRAAPGLANLALVALSGYGSDDDGAAARAKGFAWHVIKGRESNLLPSVLKKIAAEFAASDRLVRVPS